MVSADIEGDIGKPIPPPREILILLLLIVKPRCSVNPKESPFQLLSMLLLCTSKKELIPTQFAPIAL